MNRRHFLRGGLWVAGAAVIIPRKSIAQICSGVGRPAVGACTTGKDSFTGVSAGSSDIGNYSWIGQSFTAGSTYTTCKCVARMSSNSVLATASVTAAIYTNVSSAPGYRIGYFSDPVLQTAMGASEGDVTFSNIIAPLVSGTTYWICIYQTSNITGTNYFSWYLQTGGGFTNLRSSTGDIGAWVANNGTNCQKFTLYA